MEHFNLPTNGNLPEPQGQHQPLILFRRNNHEDPISCSIHVSRRFPTGCACGLLCNQGDSLPGNNPVKQPIQIHLEANLAKGNSQTVCPTVLYTVPKGKELVVEYVSMWGVSSIIESATIDISRNGVQSEYMFFLEHKGDSQIGDPLYGANQQTRLYFGPGEILNYCVARDASTDDLGYRIRLSGYLVDKRH